MATENPSPPARYVTLRDYIRVLRRYRLMIAALVVVGALAGYIAASRQTPVYQATAEISYQDPSQDLSIAGIGSSASQTPGQLASIDASTATTPSVMAAAKRRLKTLIPASDLSGDITTQVAAPSGLLQISATDTDPNLAHRLSNAVAAAVVDRDNAQTHAQFAHLVSNVRRQIALAKRAGSAASGQLGYYEGELARLNTVANLARSAQIAFPAQLPTASTTPGKGRNTALGLVLGLLLGVIVAFVRDALDRRLRDLPDVTSTFRLPVLGHVREHAMGQVVQSAEAAGEDGSLDIEAFRILRRNLDFLDPTGAPHSVLVTSAVPEEGKTTVAGSLALAMAMAGKRVLLVDCDLRRPTLAGRLQARPRPGLTDYLAGKVSAADILQTVRLPLAAASNGARASGNGHHRAASASLVFVASGSHDPRCAELLGSPRLSEFLKETGAAYDAIVLDSSPLLPVSDTRELLPHVDAVILCARAAQTTRDQATAAKTALSQLPQRPTGLVITGVSTHADEYGAYAYAYAHDEA
jgi:capsular exopolysaccharide synthesis family protein